MPARRRALHDNLHGLRAAADHVCAAVPFSLHASCPPVPDSLAHLRRLRVPDAVAGASLPLYIMHYMACIEVLPPAQRRWLRGRIAYIAERDGLAQAHAYASDAFPGFLFGEAAVPSVLGVGGGWDDAGEV